MELAGQSLGRYQQLELLGKGGMGEVYKAFDPILDREVALKVLPPLLANDETFVERFHQEIRAVAKLNHPNIVTVHDADRNDNMSYLVMEYVPGGTLKGLIEREAPLPPEQVSRIISQVASALDYAHAPARRMIHRDIKPANILINAEGVPKLTDFGLVKVSDVSLTITGQKFGTPHYMAPEQIQGGAVGPWTDVYALAIVTYEMLVGFVPFQGSMSSIFDGHIRRPPPLLRQFNATLPPTIETVVLKALIKMPEGRYASAGEFADALHQALSDPSRPPVAAAVPMPDPDTQFYPPGATTPVSNPGTALPSYTPTPPDGNISTPAPTPAPAGKRRRIWPWLVGLAGVGALTLLCVAVVAMAMQLLPNEQREIDALLETANQAFAQRQGMDAAIDAYQQVLDYDEHNLTALNRLALIYNLRDRESEAEAVARQALEVNPDSAFAHAMLASALASQHQDDEALEAVNRAVSLAADSPVVYSYRAIIQADQALAQSDQQMLRQAVDDAEKAIQLSQDERPLEQALAHNARSVVYWQENLFTPDTIKVRRGFDELNRAITLQEQLAVFHSNLGYFHNEQGYRDLQEDRERAAQEEFQLAQERFNEALEVDSKYAHAHAGLGFNYYYRENYQAAHDQFDQAIELDPQDTEAYIGKNWAYREQGNFEQALAILEKAHAADPLDVDVLVELGWTYREQAFDLEGSEEEEAHDNAEEQFNAALKLNDRYTAALNGLGWIYNDQERYAESVARFQNSIEIKEDQDSAHNGLGWSLYYLDDYSASERHFRRALELNDQFADAMVGLAYTLEASGNDDEAARYYQRACVSDPGHWYCDNAPASATAVAAATPTVTAPLPATGLVYGPANGELAHDEDDAIESDAADVNLRNFVVEARFVNPPTESWDYGFFFRRTDTNQEYRLSVDSASEWIISYGPDGEQVSGDLENLATAAGESNLLRIIVRERNLLLFVNDAYITTLDVSEYLVSGNIMVATGFFSGSEYSGAATVYQDFAIWSLDEALYGPRAGDLEHLEPGQFRFLRTDLQVRDFITQARFANPYDASRALWNYGFLFRKLGEDAEYRLTLFSNQTWDLDYSTSRDIAAGEVPGMNTSAKGANDMLLIVLRGQAYLFVNDEYVTTMDVSEQLEAGDVAVATGTFEDTKIPGEVTPYENFVVWSLDP